MSKHIENIFSEGKLIEKATVSKMEIVQQEGSRMITRTVEHYSLDVIISVGYRIKSLVMNEKNAIKH
ncbi:MAG: virulence RhuM family protein [Bacteroidales bacterium]|nr:virulence RhuM family protein [Bacteroidales bacterium]NLK81554.1 virulence RhuM family protein [Bacteroidales bacterium]